jgi:hypothetical protein
MDPTNKIYDRIGVILGINIFIIDENNNILFM